MEPIAIVGLSVRYPGFNGPSAFFDSCRSASSRLQRFEHEMVCPYLQDNPRGAKHPYRINNDLYGSIRGMSWIDAKRFRVPPKDIDGDPSPFVCVQLASEALEDYQAGRSNKCIPKERTGVIIGRGDHPHRGLWSGLQGGTGFELIRELLLERTDLFTQHQVDAVVETLLQRMKPFPNPSLASSLVSNVISGLVANRLDLQGPNFLVDAACTSAIVAIQQATRSLIENETDLMLVGAIQGTMSVQIIQMFSMLGAIANEDIQPFNPMVEGTLLSEGVGFVALKRLESARSDGDRIYAVIRGLGLASDGNDSAVLAPSSRGQILAMRNTYNMLDGIEPDDIGFLEAHATGINLGDDTELNSIQEIFRPEKRNRPLVLGALKSLIGHSIPASGMAALIRACYAVAFGVYPVSRCASPNEKLSIRNGMFLPTTMYPWYERPSVPRRAAINSFGFGGINGHLVVEQEIYKSDYILLHNSGLVSSSAPKKQSKNLVAADTAPPRAQISTGCPVHLICLSFTNTQELVTVASQALEACSQRTTGGRSCQHFSAAPVKPGTFRIGLVGRDLGLLQSQLQILLDEPDCHHNHSQRIPEHVPKLAVMLPGEAQVPFGYLSELTRYIPSVKALMEFVDSSSRDGSILADSLHPAWSSLLSQSTIDILQKQANHHDYATKALFVVSIAYFGLLRTLGLEVSALTGHSTGEINALMLAGGLQCDSESDIRSILSSFETLYADNTYLDQVVEGTVVLAAGLTEDKLIKCLESDSDVYLVSDNSPSHRLIFSQHKSLEQLSELIGAHGGFVLPTKLNRAYHTPLFALGAEVMRSFYEQFKLVPLKKTVYSCCSTEPYPDSIDVQVELLVRQWKEPVRFRQVLLNMYRDGYRCFLELNAQRTLIGFSESTFYGIEDVSLLSTGTTKEVGAIDAFAQAIVGLWTRGLNVDLEQWDSLFMFPAELSLPKIERPSSAVSISHDLHRLGSEDFRAAWSQTNPDVIEASLAPSEIIPSKLSLNLNHSPNNPTSVAPANSSAIHQHQLTMRRALDSMERNTCLAIDQLNQTPH